MLPTRASTAAPAALFLALVLTGLLHCQSTAPGEPSPAVRWAAGPQGWLLAADDRRLLATVGDAAGLAVFESAFWARREPGTAALVRQRAADADRLYAEEANGNRQQRRGPSRGSLTDRGRALILLGAPPILRSSRRNAPVWDPRRSDGPAPTVASTSLRLETWVYPVSDLPPRGASELGLGPGEQASLVFVVKSERPPRERSVGEPRVAERVELIEGERVLAAAARALLTPDADRSAP
jgi:hypothetical protein